MHTIEPYFNWRNLYLSAEDPNSPFYGREYNEFEFSNHIYDHIIHPQWDYFGSPTMYAKILYVEYDERFAIIELIGEWNDCIHNDIMFFKRDVIEPIMKRGVNQFIIIGENVLNFHASDDCYYEEWEEELEGGWIIPLNFQAHVLKEFEHAGISRYFFTHESFNDFPWRPFRPLQLYQKLLLGIEYLGEPPMLISR